MTTNITDRTRTELTSLAQGNSISIKSKLFIFGPAIIASVAYMDPGNYATNIQAGAGYGYKLLWVVVLANLIAILFQALSARIGIVTGKNLAELSRDHLPKPLVWVMWVVSEIAAMATDLAEFLGGAIALSLLFDLPLIAGMGITAIITYGLLLFESKGFRPMELIIGAFVAIIGLCYLAEIFITPVNWGEAGQAILSPSLPDNAALFIAVGIIGATVMPHAIFLHSGLTQSRVPTTTTQEKARIVRFSNYEVVIALAIAGMINMSMVIMAAGAFYPDNMHIAEIETAYQMLTPILGTAAAVFFLASLLASGISSSVVGTMAGQMIMLGFLNIRLPLWLRRVITMAPAFVVVALGVNSTEALVMSQVVLSIALPVPMLSLIYFVTLRDLMGSFAITGIIKYAAYLGASIVLTLNFVLLADVFGITLIAY
jgi:manganese transport protein